jgi:hypothetical protein
MCVYSKDIVAEVLHVWSYARESRNRSYTLYVLCIHTHPPPNTHTHAHTHTQQVKKEVDTMLVRRVNDQVAEAVFEQKANLLKITSYSGLIQ